MLSLPLSWFEICQKNTAYTGHVLHENHLLYHCQWEWQPAKKLILIMLFNSSNGSGLPRCSKFVTKLFWKILLRRKWKISCGINVLSGSRKVSVGNSKDLIFKPFPYHPPLSPLVFKAAVKIVSWKCAKGRFLTERWV